MMITHRLLLLTSFDLKPHCLSPSSAPVRLPSFPGLRFQYSAQSAPRVVHSEDSPSHLIDIDISHVDDEYMKKRLEGSNDDGDGEKAKEEEEMKEEDEGFSFSSLFGGRDGKEEEDYDRDPELADILGTFIDDPKKGQARVEDRIRKKRSKILHTKTGSPTPIKVVFNKFDFSNSYMWLEFYHTPLPNYITLICDTIRSWHIIGRLGGCNSMNMQLSQAPLDIKRPSYDAIQGANVTPTTFYNIGDLEIQDNLARIWVDIGTIEPLLLDILINALTSISSDQVGIKQVVFGGTEFGNWKENLKLEDAGYSSHKI